MATHSTVLAWRIPGMAESGGLPSVGSHRVGHDWSDLTAAYENLDNILDILQVVNINKSIVVKIYSLFIWDNLISSLILQMRKMKAREVIWFPKDTPSYRHFTPICKRQNVVH